VGVPVAARADQARAGLLPRVVELHERERGIEREAAGPLDAPASVRHGSGP
jgi:hypothetical protein